MAWTLVFLHGVGQTVHDDEWYSSLSVALTPHDVQIPKFRSRRIVVPTYVDLLKSPPTAKVDEPTRTRGSTDSKSEFLKRRADYSRRQNEISTALPGTTDSVGFSGFGENINPGTNKILPLVQKNLKDARQYLNSPNLRYAILHRVIEKIGTQRDLIIIGHSLGSIVAIDLLAHLPEKTRVKRLITIGSPAGSPGFHKNTPDRLLQAKQFPYNQVDAWVNVLSPWDPVTYGRGITHLFPAAVDVRIALPWRKHASAVYLAHPSVAKVLADAVKPVSRYETTSKELAVALTRDESLAIDQIIFATKVLDCIEVKSDRHERFELALRHVAAEVGRELASQRTASGQPRSGIVAAVSEGRFDGLTLARRSITEQLLFAIVAGTNNPVAPFDVEVEKEQNEAISRLWVSFENPVSDGRKIASAIEEAKGVFGRSDGWKWLVFGAAGLALIAVPPVGIALGGAGLAGGAALTAGLAAFGPGGMVGGMALAGGLIGVGSSASAVAASRRLPGAMSPDMLQTQVIRYLAFTRAMQSLDLPGDRSEGWLTLSAWHDELSRELGVLLLFSDKGSSAIKTVEKKLEILSKALSWMVDEGLSLALGE